MIVISASENGYQYIRLSLESFIDIEEREHLTWMLEDVKRYYRKCKRKHLSFNPEFAAEFIAFPGEPKDLEYEISRRVEKFGDKATIEGLHDSIHEHCRKKLYEEMIRLGWEEKQAYLWIWKCFKKENSNDGNKNSMV